MNVEATHDMNINRNCWRIGSVCSHSPRGWLTINYWEYFTSLNPVLVLHVKNDFSYEPRTYGVKKSINSLIFYHSRDPLKALDLFLLLNRTQMLENFNISQFSRSTSLLSTDRHRILCHWTWMKEGRKKGRKKETFSHICSYPVKYFSPHPSSWSERENGMQIEGKFVHGTFILDISNNSYNLVTLNSKRKCPKSIRQYYICLPVCCLSIWLKNEVTFRCTIWWDWNFSHLLTGDRHGFK